MSKILCREDFFVDIHKYSVDNVDKTNNFCGYCGKPCGVLLKWDLICE